MKIIHTIKDINNQINILKKADKKIGFVPTMGALHKGHISLINRSKRENDVTVCSIFVNPTQFNDPKDFEKYPVTIARDTQLLEQAKCDLLFLPTVKEMYPDGFKSPDPIDFGYIAGTLEGAFRPGHFNGMAQIVEKLLLAVAPHHLYMGQKDYQQAMICAALIRKRRMKVKLIVCPIKREKDGLAMSSRNVRLESAARLKAVEIVKMLRWVKRAVNGQRSTVNKLRTRAVNYQPPATSHLPTTSVEQKAFDRLAAFPEFRVEYVAIRDAKTLKPIRRWDAGTQAVALVAAHIGGVRLIDNMLL
jgi:pantoate--beta-alanine ligase